MAMTKIKIKILLSSTLLVGIDSYMKIHNSPFFFTDCLFFIMCLEIPATNTISLVNSPSGL